MKKISIKNTEALDLAIREAEGRATARCIDSECIRRVLHEVDMHLAKFSTRKNAIGTVVHADPNAQTFPRAYKYTPESTHFTAVLTASGWMITYICRDTTRGPMSRIQLELTDATKAGMAEKLSILQ